LLGIYVSVLRYSFVGQNRQRCHGHAFRDNGTLTFEQAKTRSLKR
jgi:hypothetical protein